eukprot:gene7258-biopygen14079
MPLLRAAWFTPSWSSTTLLSNASLTGVSNKGSRRAWASTMFQPRLLYKQRLVLGASLPASTLSGCERRKRIKKEPVKNTQGTFGGS